MKLNRAELATCFKFLHSICRGLMRAPTVVSQALYLYSSSVHILLSKSGICDVTGAVICLRNLGKLTASESMYIACTLHYHPPSHHHQSMKGNSLNASPSYMLQKLLSARLNLLAPQITAPH